MAIFLTLAGVAIIPILLTTLFPKNREYFDREEVKGFVLGVYLILIIVLLREAIEISNIGKGFLWFGIGLTISLFIGFLFKEFHHHHSEAEEAIHHNKASTWRILSSDFFHNIVDGIAIIAGFTLSASIGALSFLAVLGHQIIQQAGQQILLVESGLKPKRAILVSFIISLSIFLGYFIKEGSALESILIALSAGIVSWKVAVDILHAKWTKKMATGFAFGAFILAMILILVPHVHEPDPQEAIDKDHTEELVL